MGETPIPLSNTPSHNPLKQRAVTRRVNIKATSAFAKGLPILFIVDRPLDMCWTAANVFGDACGTVYVERKEGENPLSGPIPE
jgi:Na+/H+-dicarboxylate symporter